MKQKYTCTKDIKYEKYTMPNVYNVNKKDYTIQNKQCKSI